MENRNQAKKNKSTFFKSINKWEYWEDKIQFIKKNNNYKVAMDFAKEGLLQHENEIALYMLAKAYECKPDDVDDAHFVALLSSFNSLSFDLLHPYIFTDKATLFLNLIIKLDKIKSIAFGKHVPATLVNSIANFIAKSKSLEKLDISENAFRDISKRLSDEQIQPIIAALAVNMSLRKLDLSHQFITDQGLQLILDALKNNPNTKLDTIWLEGTRVSRKGMELYQNYYDSKRVDSIKKVMNVFNMWYRGDHYISAQEFLAERYALQKQGNP